MLLEPSRVEMALTEPQTKAHFEDVNGSACFVWDVGSSMIAVVGHDSAPVKWNGGEYYYSPMHISLIDPANPNRVLRACSEHSLESNAAKAGDTLFFLSPVSGSALCSTAASAESVTVEFSMPSLFEQSTSQALEEFEPYCYIRGESSVKSVPSASKNFVANSTAFRAIPAIFRFNVSNNTNSDMVLESVKITCDKLFPDKLCWTTNGASMSVGETADKSGYFNTIKTSINWGRGETIPAKAGETVHK